MKAGWVEKPIGKVLQLEYGKPLDQVDRKPDGLYPVYGANGEKDRSDKFYFDKPSIIVGRKGSAGEINLTEEKFWPLDVTYFVTFDERQYDLRFLYYILTTLELPNLAKGVKPGINRNEVYSLVAKFPPLPEQQRIVRILDEAFEGIATATANAEKNLHNARALFEGYREAVFRQRGEEWVDAKLGAICHKITDGTHVTPTYTKEGVPFLSVKNLTQGFIDFSNAKFISVEEHAFLTKSNKPMRDDVLYTKVGTTGIAKVVDVDDEFSIFVSVALLKPKHDFVFNLYLEHFLNAPYAREQARKRTRGMANKNLVITDIKEIEVHFPKSLGEQRTIVSKLDALRAETQRLESIYRRKLTVLDELKKSLLHRAFAGEL